ncbi:MAG TPA: molybdopterin-guanine dinucleotide biosynthesis protein B [Desulfobacterales bacterium]|nr:molybdopterin-guanine dinucleotide biosynthesis protein B [Desulfobacterales bacterium]
MTESPEYYGNMNRSGGLSQLKALAVVGPSNCGKTELICRLLKLYNQQGLRVAAVKHSHKAIEVDRPGKDTWRFRQAGAQAVALATRGMLQITQVCRDDPPVATVLAALPPDLDFVLIEGYKSSLLPKLVFLPSEEVLSYLPEYSSTIAFISGVVVDTPLPLFSREQVPEIGAFILQWLTLK